MHLYDDTSTTPEANLALDEALLIERSSGEALRLWESPQPLVVMGRSTRIEEEVDLPACRHRGVPLLRRISGGASIVAGPGCLMYAVVLDVARRPEIEGVGHAHQFVLKRLVDAIAPLENTIRIAGTSDLALLRDGDLLKCSGNSMRLARGRLLYHGTLLYAFDLAIVSELLLTAPRQPDYRQRRDHNRFIANLNSTRDDLKRRLIEVWSANPTELPSEVIRTSERLTEDRYQSTDWNTGR